MLRQLILGSVRSDFILIHDHKEANGQVLLNEFIQQNVKLQNNTNLLNMESSPYITKNVPNAVNFNHYCMTDYRAWLKDKSGQIVKDGNNPTKILHKILNVHKLDSKTVIIIDSLALFLLLYSDLCYKTIHQIVNYHAIPGQKQQQLICLLHNDILPEEKCLKMFEQLATTNLYVLEEKKKSQVIIKHRKASGRIIHTVEQFSIDKIVGLTTKEVEKPNRNFSEKVNKKEWANSDVTFRLELEDEEKRARSELVLPYLKTSKQLKTGEIIYEPDASDDWDEEDPDDDLNI